MSAGPTLVVDASRAAQPHQPTVAERLQFELAPILAAQHLLINSLRVLVAISDQVETAARTRCGEDLQTLLTEACPGWGDPRCIGQEWEVAEGLARYAANLCGDILAEGAQ